MSRFTLNTQHPIKYIHPIHNFVTPSLNPKTITSLIQVPPPNASILLLGLTHPLSPLSTPQNDTKLTVTFDFTVLFQNPNQKLSVSYKNLEAKVWFGNENFNLASTPLPPFSQEIETETKVQAHMVVVDGYIDGDVAKEIAPERAHGSVSLGVKVLGWIRFNPNSSTFHTGYFPLKVTCEPVVILFPPDKNNNTGTLMALFNCYSI
ncbi:Late embryogenesis abundant protein [Sesbania bispinosa]|nr:Late embryogenesis abundant protein [Sesbania bispinosa]